MMETVAVTSDFPPETPSAAKRKPSSLRERSSFAPRKLARQLVFTEFGLSPVAAASPPLSAEKFHSPAKLRLALRSPFSLTKPDSPRSVPQPSPNINDGTPKIRKICHCKQSRCLKLYCECFASGAYCEGCSCAACHNTVENEEERAVATESILERNPDAFKPKIGSSPPVTQVEGDLANDIPVMGKHNKGCQCKRTNCLKRYCECFQANVFCSENCRCFGCNNLEGNEWRKVISLKHENSAKAAFEQTNASATSANESSGNSLSSACRKRGFQELLDDKKKSSSIMQKLTQLQQENSLMVSGSFPAFSAAHVHHDSSTVPDLSTFTYRSLLADVIHPHDTRELCSLLMILSEAAKFLAGSAQDKKKCMKGPDVQKLFPTKHLREDKTYTIDMDNSRYEGTQQEGRLFQPKAEELMGSEIDKSVRKDTSANQTLYPDGIGDVYLEQERLVLKCFMNCLGNLINIGEAKARIVIENQLEHLSGLIIKVRSKI